MSYRTFKHLLGETSLERKCRFIFGGGLFVLVSLSFSWYGAKTESLVAGQTRTSARRLVSEILLKFHSMEETKVNPDGAQLLEKVDLSLKKQDDLENYEGRVIRLSDANNPVTDFFDRESMGKFLKSQAKAAGPAP